MITDYVQLAVGPLTVEANWNPSVTPGKAFRVKLDGKEAIIERDDLYALMMLFGNEKQQEELIPVQQVKVRAITRMLKVRAQRDLRRGQVISFPYTYFVPEAIYERLLSSRDYQAPGLSTPDLEKHVNKAK